MIQGVHPAVFILIATVLEVCGDAIIRSSIYNQTGTYRFVLWVLGALLVAGYGTALNLAPVQFGQVVGLYIAMLFVVWQVITFIAFRTVPTMPILLGGALIVGGGLIVTFWK